MPAATALFEPSRDFNPRAHKLARLHGKRWFNPEALNSRHRCDQFVWHVWGFQAAKNLDVDPHLEQLQAFIRDAAVKFFGKPVATPVKPIVSHGAWFLLARIAPLRRMLNATQKVMMASVTLTVFL